jgi:hypothetical protein
VAWHPFALQGRLQLPSVGAGDLGLRWITGFQSGYHSIDAVRAAGVQDLANLYLAVALAFLLLAAVCLTALAVARSRQREADLGVRRAVGAPRRVLALALATEATILGALAVVPSLLVGPLTTRAAVRGWGGTVTGSIAPTFWLVPGALVLILVLGGLLPLVLQRRFPATDPAGGGIPLRVPLLVVAAALAVTGTGIGSMLRGRHLAAVARLAPALTVWPLALLPSAPEERAAVVSDLLARLDGIPGGSMVSLTDPGTPLGLGALSQVRTSCGECYWAGLPLSHRMVTARHQFVTADSFDALGIPVLEGRGFTAADRLGAQPVAVVSQGLASKYFQGGQAVGRTLQPGDDPQIWYTVVGVAAEVRSTAIGSGRAPVQAVYLSLPQHPPQVASLLTAANGPTAEIGRVLAATPGVVLLAAPRPLRDLLEADAHGLAWFSRWLAIEGWGMIALATGTVFVLLRLWVRSLAPTIGIWLAVGAGPRVIWRYLAGQGLVVGCLGGLAGNYLGWMVAGGVSDLVPGLGGWPTGWAFSLTASLATAALLGVLLPARGMLRCPPVALLGHSGD